MIVAAMRQTLAIYQLGFVAALSLLGGAAWLGAQPATEPARVALLSVSDAIGPATSDYIQRGIAAAGTSGAGLVVLQLDTPGGLDSSMRDIIQSILASEVPVATYVAPQGARAASAGTYILYSSHIAAMAPATTTGAATPVSIGGSSNPFSPPEAPDTDADEDAPSDDGAEEPAMPPAAPSVPEPATASERKAINDAVSYIRSLAERRGRNAEWAEAAVRSADSISAQTALELNVIDLIAADLDDLLRQLDGRAVTINDSTIVLNTENALVERIDPDWRNRVLAAITNPEVAYILLLIGIYGLLFEGYNPGAILPGVVGAISLLLALFALQVLPVNYAGLALIVLGVVLMIAEFLVPSFGSLGFGGIAAFVFGSLILIDVDAPGFVRPTGLVVSIATTAAGGMLAIAWLAMRSRHRPVVSGVEQMLSEPAIALEDFESTGAVRTHGERWLAQTKTPVKAGQMLKVRAIDGLLLHVEPVGSDETP